MSVGINHNQYIIRKEKPTHSSLLSNYELEYSLINGRLITIQLIYDWYNNVPIQINVPIQVHVPLPIHQQDIWDIESLEWSVFKKDQNPRIKPVYAIWKEGETLITASLPFGTRKRFYDHLDSYNRPFFPNPKILKEIKHVNSRHKSTIKLMTFQEYIDQYKLTMLGPDQQGDAYARYYRDLRTYAFSLYNSGQLPVYYRMNRSGMKRVFDNNNFFIEKIIVPNQNIKLWQKPIYKVSLHSHDPINNSCVDYILINAETKEGVIGQQWMVYTKPHLYEIKDCKRYIHRVLSTIGIRDLDKVEKNQVQLRWPFIGLYNGCFLSP